MFNVVLNTPLNAFLMAKCEMLAPQTVVITWVLDKQATCIESTLKITLIRLGFFDRSFYWGEGMQFDPASYFKKN